MASCLHSSAHDRGDFVKKWMDSHGSGDSMADLKSVATRIFKKYCVVTRALEVPGSFDVATARLNDDLS